MANIELLDQIISHVEANPETWDQAVYYTPTECGSAYCVFGHAAVMTMGQVTPVEYSTEFFDSAGKRHTWYLAGMRALGLTCDQANVLSHESNTLGEIKAMRELLDYDPNVQLSEYFQH